MSDINQAYYDRVRYTLYNKTLGSEIITEPIGWQDDQKEYVRDDTYHGIVSKLSNSLKFNSASAAYIQTVYDVEGINGEVRLTRDEKHPKTDVWTKTYSGYLDMSTYEKEDGVISLKFNAGGLEQLLKARANEQVEIDRTTTIDGKALSELAPVTVNLDGRGIFLKSKWEIKQPDDHVNLYIYSDAGNVRNQTAGIPFHLLNQSHENAHNVLMQSLSNESVGTTGMMFFAVSDKRRVLNIDLKFSFKIFIGQEDVDSGYFKIYLSKFGDSGNYTPLERNKIFGLDDKNAVFGANGKTYSANYKCQVVLEVGESLAIESHLWANFGGPGHAELRVDLSQLTGAMTVEENSFHEKSQAKALLPFEVVERLVNIGTNRSKAIYSDFLGRAELGYQSDGVGALIGLTHGFWIRQFDKLPLATEGPPKMENNFKPLTTSLNDFMTSFGAVWNIGMGIESVNNTEVVRIEEKGYFFNNRVTIRLKQVSKVKRYPATEYCFSSLEFGYEKGGNYEEACGLDEYNAKSTFTTIINRVKEPYSKVSKYRSDSYGIEFARRKPKTLNDTEDTSYDNDIFMLDLKKGTVANSFLQRKWQDDFEVAPNGTFSPETATNLRLSPFHCLLRHAWWFGAGLVKYATDYVRYSSSTANSRLVTKVQGKPEFAESGNVINSELPRAKFVADWIEFEHKCDFEVMQMVEGHTMILGRRVPNFYGLVEFINEEGKKELGYLFNLKPNGSGKWKVLKANL